MNKGRGAHREKEGHRVSWLGMYSQWRGVPGEEKPGSYGVPPGWCPFTYAWRLGKREGICGEGAHREKGNAPATLEEPELRDLVVVVQHDRFLGVLVPTADRDGENLHGT